VGAMRALAVAALVAGLLPAAVQAGQKQPRLRVTATSPLAIRGFGFGPHERIKLAASVGKKTELRSLSAGAGGAFVARFPQLVYDRCHGALKVAAFGSRGHRVSFVLQPLECPNSAGA
jgi:hypothetical protein